MKPTRIRQAAVAGLAAFGSLIIAALWFGGLEHVLEITGSALRMFFAIAIVAASIGSIPKPRAWYVAAAIGAVIGLIGAGCIALSALAGI
jgi:hypothetical protein